MQPTNQTVGAGTTVTLAVTATGTAPLSYQWRERDKPGEDGEARSDGATTNMLTINNAQTNNSGSYTVIVTNFGGSVTSSDGRPDGGIVAGDHSATNEPDAGGGIDCDLYCHRRRDTAVELPMADKRDEPGGWNEPGWKSISGTTTNVLTISNAQTNNSGTNYTVIVTNSAGSVTSSNAALTVVRLMVVAWGDNDYGQTNVPVDATNVMAIAGGGYHSLALQTNGTVVAWGCDDSGQTDVPADLTNVVAIAAGYLHSLALQANGTVVAWGDNTDGQTNVPADLTNVVAIAGGGYHSLALQTNGTVVAWGAVPTIPVRFLSTARPCASRSDQCGGHCCRLLCTVWRSRPTARW